MSTRLELTILTGFLGAGKTTLLNAYLRHPQAKGTAVLVNEFGAIDVDGAVLEATPGRNNRVMSLPNGCICCEVQDDLAEALIALAESGESRRGILETTGLADPGAILRGVAHDPRLKTRINIAATICLVGAPNISRQYSDFSEARAQVALADRIVITKTDLLSDQAVEDVRCKVTRLNPIADILIRTPDDCASTAFAPAPKLAPPPPLSHHHSHGISTFSVSFPGPLDRDIFRDTLSFWILRHAEKLLRVKGLVKFAGDPVPQLVNGVHDVFTSEPMPLAFDERGGGMLVFIGNELAEDDLRADLQACVAT